MPRYRLIIEYAGTRYSGWQVQKNARTVQGELLRAARTATGDVHLELYGSGRTDAGVHALRQVAHLDTRTRHPTELLRLRLNDDLPADINVLEVTPASPKFHARHDAVARSYLYQIARRRTAFAKPFVWWVKEPLDVAAMREAAAALAGFRDYRAFTDADPDEGSTEVAVDTFELHDAGDLLLVRVVGSHFLWKMVRRLVGVLVEVGRGGLSPSDPAASAGTSHARVAQLTAPAAGLFLERVYYPGDPREHGWRPVVNL